MLRIRRWLKLTEPDDFEHGCDNDNGQVGIYDLTVEAPYARELVDKITSAFDVEREAVTLNACDEPGRIDVQRQENERGYPPSQREVQQWRRGELMLYSTTYSAQVESVQTAGWLIL